MYNFWWGFLFILPIDFWRADHNPPGPIYRFSMLKQKTFALYHAKALHHFIPLSLYHAKALKYYNFVIKGYNFVTCILLPYDV